MNNTEYESTERTRFWRQIADVERAPLAERKAGRADWAEAMQHPDTMAERVRWLLAGNYGHGAYLIAHEVRQNKRKRMNRAAAIGSYLAALDHYCPGDMARKAWNGLNKTNQAAVNKAIIKALDDYKKEA